MKVPYVNLAIQYDHSLPEVMNALERTIRSGQYILGDEVAKAEERFAALCGTRHAIGVANGTDSLILAMKSLGIGTGDEVITAPNSFLASCSSIVLAGATPVFADVREDMNIDPEKVEAAITSRTKAIMPVHLTGRPADMDALQKIAKQHELHLIEDAAQAVGARFNGQAVGSLGTIGSFSLHPLKNLAIPGDGGMLTTNDPELYHHLVVSRNHGLINRDECRFFSLNSRLDALQAAILNVKMNSLETDTERRRAIARIYHEAFRPYCRIPEDREHEFSVYHTYIIQTNKRDQLQEYLKSKGVESKVHYPIPIHLQEAAKHLGYGKGSFPNAEKQAKEILSLPVYPELTNDQVLYVAACVVDFFNG